MDTTGKGNDSIKITLFRFIGAFLRSRAPGKEN